MAQSRTRFVGMAVRKETLAVASVAPEPGAAVTALGTLGPRPWAREQRIRKRPSTAPQRLCISAAGPCGSWLSRSLQKKDYACWVVAPSLLPQQAARARFERHFGEVDFTDAAGADNEQIDADLAREYADTHEAP